MHRKKLNRQRRLQAARKWLKNYNGTRLVKGYAKHFGVNKLCAVEELRMLDITISAEYEQQLRQSMEAERKLKQLRKDEREKNPEAPGWDSDEHFAMIIGYTSGGFPYGLSHEEWEEIERDAEKDR